MSFVAGEIVMVTAGPLKDCKVKLKESDACQALIVEGCIPEYLTTGDFVVFAIHKETGCLYSQEPWFRFAEIKPIIAKVDHLKDSFMEENKDVVKTLKRIAGMRGALSSTTKSFVLHDVLGFMGYTKVDDRQRIINEFL